MADRAQNFIDGRWVEASGKACLESLNPANKSEVLTTFPRSDHRDVDRAVEAARAAARQWARAEPGLRHRVLRQAAESLARRSEELATLIVRESGKLLPDAREEVLAAVELLGGVAAEALQAMGAAAWSSSGACLRAAAPRGVAAVLAPWTFPLALPAVLAGAALAAGNAVVLKPSEDTPLVAARLVDGLLEAGLPPAVLGLVQGTGEEAGAPLVRHPEAGLVAFAGFPDVAREVAIACAAERKRAIALAMGREAVLVLDDGDAELAVARIAAGTFALSGRRRPALHIVLQGKAGRQVQERLLEVAQAARPGDGLLPETTVPPLVNDRQVKRLHAYVRLAVKEGARLLTGGEAYRDGEGRKGFFYAPTILAEVTPKMRAAQDEVAGPVLALLPAATPEEAVERTNRLPTGRAVSLYARDVGKALRLAGALAADAVRINDGGPGTPEARAWLLGPLADQAHLVERFARWRRLEIAAARAAEGGRP